MHLYAFEGLRYDRDAEGAGRLAAPPYDQIDDRLRDRFHAESADQFVHLTRPVATAETAETAGDPYRHAAEVHERWLREGRIVRDPKPALYPYVIDLAGGGRRLGVCGLVELADAATIRPHEQTLDKAIADRTALLDATRVDLEPALLLSEDGGRLDALVAEDVASREPLVDHLDADGHHHRLFKVDDPGRIARYQEVLAGPAAIADGHHRYKVAQRFARAHEAPAGSAAAAKLAVVTSLASPALTIDPIHRALKGPLDLERIAGFASSRRTVEAASGAELAAKVAAAPGPALGLWVAGREPEVWRLDPAKAPGDLPAGARELAVVLLHGALLPALGFAPESATDGTVIYRSDPDVLFRMVQGGEAGTGLWLPPMQPAEFAAAIANGDMLPPKSTRFLPKVMSGLVWADHDSALS